MVCEATFKVNCVRCTVAIFLYCVESHRQYHIYNKRTHTHTRRQARKHSAYRVATVPSGCGMLSNTPLTHTHIYRTVMWSHVYDERERKHTAFALFTLVYQNYWLSRNSYRKHANTPLSLFSSSVSLCLSLILSVCFFPLINLHICYPDA